MNQHKDRVNKIITVSLLFGAQLFSYMIRYALSIVAPTLMKQYHLSPETMGYILSGWNWSYTAGLPILGPLLFRGFDNRQKIAKVHAPMLFFHGDRDDIVPLRMGRELYNAALAPKTVFEVHGAGHNDLPPAAGQNYRRKLQEFYASLRP